MLSPGAPLIVTPAENASPGPDELLVRNHAWAFNPADWKAQAFGLYVHSYSAVFGCDMAGEVVKAGSGISRFQVGDRIAAVPLGAITQNPREQAFQTYTIVPACCALVIPPQMSCEDAVKLPLGLFTAAAGLYEEQYLNLPLPKATPVPSGKTLLVCAGSSNVGSAVIQLALASGVEVCATASKENADLVRSMGVEHVFDHHDNKVVDDVSAALRGRDVVGGFDPISSNATIVLMAKILSGIGSSKLVTTLPVKDTWPLPSSVHVKQGISPLTG
ncbi:hypothetical protein LTR78_001254 [Recurvomyces mirabilis]|uniref:Enoyl reductase (ER) domain-containing protein n=1 Tax=Recurvomyces mirabilis TaxID=574656 RepID=A0AAE0WWG7_9PEZI|nr:hypothetical protein LTR78_001254 [Recurvomyces mirabilis]KAK5161230.1 hypothetical protein LTS14_001026 [Recurvomyces mirabilis]